MIPSLGTVLIFGMEKYCDVLYSYSTEYSTNSVNGFTLAQKLEYPNQRLRGVKYGSSLAYRSVVVVVVVWIDASRLLSS